MSVFENFSVGKLFNYQNRANINQTQIIKAYYPKLRSQEEEKQVQIEPHFDRRNLN
jgi:hypothetical protein